MRGKNTPVADETDEMPRKRCLDGQTLTLSRTTLIVRRRSMEDAELTNDPALDSTTAVALSSSAILTSLIVHLKAKGVCQMMMSERSTNWR